jgi:hypothetical protein
LAGSLLAVRTSGGFAGRATGDAPPPYELAVDRRPADDGLSPYTGRFPGIPGDALVTGDDADAA